MTFSIGILTLSILYALFLNIIFSTKEKMDTPEEKAFLRLIIANLISLFFELGTILGMIFLSVDSLITNIVYRVFLSSIVVFDVLFLDYNYTIAVGYDYYNEHRKRIHFNIYASAIIAFLLALLCPSELQFTEGGLYSTGLGVDILYLLSFAVSGLMFLIICSSVRKKKTKFKDYPAWFVITIGLVISVVIQSIDHRWNLITVMETVSLLVMYFTIENPDIKTIEKLNMAKNEAEKASKAKTDFLSSMSHELRTPLNAIVGFSNDIKARKNEVSEEVSADVDYVVEASNRLLEIVGNILDINKIESSNIEVSESIYNLREELKPLIDTYKTKTSNKPIEFSVDFDKYFPDWLIGDISIIKEIVSNLLSNAIKYTDEGKVYLKMVFSKEDDNKGILFISCEDTGKGISEENQTKLFSKFERLDTVINSNIEGTGLGLAITKSLVDIMDGTITVDSIEGEGTTFIVKIPQKIVKAEDLNNNKELFNKSILVVDDNELNVKVAEMTLVKLGLNVSSCNNVSDCINKIKSGEKFDVILLDEMIEDMDGSLVLQRLKEIDGFNIPVIAFIADTVVDNGQKYLDQGFCSSVPKPFTENQIRDAISKIK